MPRFSLTTLMLMTLCVALWMLVWAWTIPWVAIPGSYTPPENSLYPVATAYYSPDGTRYVRRHHQDGLWIYWNEGWTSPKIFKIELPPQEFLNWDDDDIHYWKKQEVCTFAADDLIVVHQPNNQNRQFLYHRRFPEWWWGHFYRPEVWLALALTGVLLWRARRAMRAPKSVAAQRAALP